MTVMQPRDVDTGLRPRDSRDMVEFLNSAPPTEHQPTNTDKQFYGKTERRSGGLAARWKEIWGPARPDPWLPRKGAVLLLIALTIWSFYVVVGRICAPAIQGNSDQDYSVGTGVGTMIGFIILWLLFVTSYLKMVLTPPGFARDHIARSPPPPPNPPSTTYLPYHPPSGQETSHQTMTSDPAGPDPSELAPVAHAINHAVHLTPSNQPSSSATLGVDPSHGPDKAERTKTGKLLEEVERPVPRADKTPRWCRFCEIYKPDRTHHCRHCGTCVMQFDHHCVWIGQCVGWANHKFFIIFNFWAALFCLYILVFMAISLRRSDSVDGQMIGLAAVSGFFCIFTFTMFPTHIALIVSGMTTLESYAGREQIEMENSVLHREFGYVFNDHKKRKVKRRWKEEFGGVEVDQRWAVGTWMDRWKMEMGSHWVGWFLPIGRPRGDGLNFPSNRAFGPHGEWLKKKDWPHGAHATV